jgi:hypothetical protein
MSYTGWLRCNVNNEPVLDRGQQIQESIRFFFETLRRTASACAVVKAFREKKLLFPRRLKKGPNKGDLVWSELPHSRALHILHNPRCAGAFVYGRSRTRNNPNGGVSYNFVLGCHPATDASYVSDAGTNSTLIALWLQSGRLVVHSRWGDLRNFAGESRFYGAQSFPYHFFQTEYVKHGAASYIFDVLAVQRIPEHRRPRGPWPKFARSGRLSVTM